MTRVHTRDGGTRISGSHIPRKLVEPLPLHRVDIRVVFQSRPVTGIARLLEADENFRRPGVRIAAQGQPLLLGAEVVLPELALGSLR